MQKVFVKKNNEWAFWELASATMADSESATFACCGCDEATVAAKDAMKNGWVHAVWVGATEPRSESEATGRSTYVCPACQQLFDIDIEFTHLKRLAAPPQSGNRGRSSRRAPNGRNRRR